jgi:threonine aldolase
VDGKLPAAELKALLHTFYDDANHDHMVFPGMVYISHPTEFGTLYTKAELEALAEVCRAYEIPLYLDGARLGYGLAAYGCAIPGMIYFLSGVWKKRRTLADDM